MEIMRSSEIKHPLFPDMTFGEFAWCLHCMRVFRSADWASNRFHCLASDCDGSPIDVWEWERILGAHPEYPQLPEIGKEYPL